MTENRGSSGGAPENGKTVKMPLPRAEYMIREAEPGDAAAIYRLNRDEMGYDYLPERTEEKLRQLLESEADRIWVAAAGDRVIGYVHANSYDVIYAPHMKNIMGIAVDPEWKRRGIGRALLGRVEEWAQQTGAESVRLVSGQTRTGAHAFYRSCGYQGDKLQLNLKKNIAPGR